MTDSDAGPSTRTLGQAGTEADLLFEFDRFLAHRGPPGRVKAGACSRVRLLAATHPLQSTRLGRAVSARRTPWPARFMPVCTLSTNAAAAARMSSCCFFIFFVCGRIPEIRLAVEGAASRPQRKDRERTRERHMQHAQQAKSASMLADICVHQYVPYIQREYVHVNVADLHWS